jgi:hypothetical protein
MRRVLASDRVLRAEPVEDDVDRKKSTGNLKKIATDVGVPRSTARGALASPWVGPHGPNCGGDPDAAAARWQRRVRDTSLFSEI